MCARKTEAPSTHTQQNTMRLQLIAAAIALALASPATAARPRPSARTATRRHNAAAIGNPTTSLPILTSLHTGYTRPPHADPHDDTSIIAWTPPSPWYGEHEATTIARAFPGCQHPEWCDENYTNETTLAVQTAIHASQNPASCDTARLLIITDEWPSGLGSTLAIHAYTLALALSDNRIVVRDPTQNWAFAPPSLCQCDRVGTPCVPGDDPSATHVSSMDCLFIPVSKCGLPPDWKASLPWRLGAPDRVMQAPSVSEVTGISQCEATVQARSPELARFAHHLPSWWHAQLVAYIARPRPSTLTHIVAPAMANAFWATGGVPPRPLAAVFMRGGDKGSEAMLRPVDAYFNELVPVAEALNVTHVYVSSDDAALVEAALDEYDGKSRQATATTTAAPLAAGLAQPLKPPPEGASKLPPYTLHAIEWGRAKGGATFSALMASVGTWRMEHTVRLAIADLYITASADIAAGTLSSNWCRTSDALRRAAGRGRVPYATPEKQLYYSICPNVEESAPDHGKHMADWPAAVASLKVATAASWTERGR